MTSPAAARASAGFTLVELLVVVVILSFLAMFASTLIPRTLNLAEGHGGGSEVVEGLSAAARLVQLAGLPVLLFGAGFWYAVELRLPGRLDHFRLGHFLLLALTYSLFFAVFAVLGCQELPSWLAVTIAAAVSYPLLMLHVATIVDLRFALTSALPLAMLTTGILVNGVYGGELRAYVYLGMLCAVVTFLTLTYPGLISGQERRRRELEDQLTSNLAGLSPEASAARTAVATARAALRRHDPSEIESLRARVERRLEAVQRALDSYEATSGHHDVMRSAVARSERSRARLAGSHLAGRLQTRLPQTRTSLQEAIGALDEQRHRGLQLVEDPTSEHHCIACGHSDASPARFCSECGTPSAEQRQCPRCAHVLHLPRHLLRLADGESVPVTHCHCCGERHAI